MCVFTSTAIHLISFYSELQWKIIQVPFMLHIQENNVSVKNVYNFGFTMKTFTALVCWIKKVRGGKTKYLNELN